MNSTDIPLHRLYDDLAHLWPIVSPPEDYIEEAAEWRRILRDHLGSGNHEILELGVGGGHNLSHLASEFHATAVDLAPKMLANSIRLNPHVEHHVGDMRSIRLGRTFAAVLIHDAASYLQTETDLRMTCETAAAHLAPGGLLLMAPDDFRETFKPPRISHETHSDGERELTLLEYSHDPDPSDTLIETIMFFLIRERGRLRIELDRHITNLFPAATWEASMREAGFRSVRRHRSLESERQQAHLLAGVL